MKHTAFYIPALALVAALAMATASCSKNDGDSGFWFGQWRVSAIGVDTVEVSSYEGNLYFSFQSDVVEQKIVYSNHSTDQSFGHWTYSEQESTITLYFDDDLYSPLDGYLADGENILTYSRAGSSTIYLTLTEEERTVKFTLVKW